jgi:hypothetical protein
VTPTRPHAQTLKLTRADLFALTLLLLAALAFVWPLFAPGWIIPQGGGDLVSFLWPTYRYAARALHQITNNQLPITALLWNPTLYSGAPFAADNQTGLFYPPNFLLFLLFPDLPYTALEALVAFHLFLAGAGMYLFVRFGILEVGSWKLEVGLFPALAFMASDVFITHLGNLNIIAVSAYFPLILLCLRQSLITNNQLLITRTRWSIFTGLLFSLATLAGHAQMAFIIAFACALYGLYELVVQRHWRVLALGALSALVAFGLAAVALLPALEMLQHTARAALSYDEASRWSLPPLGLAGAISPLVFGRGARDFWPPWDRVELGYMGLTALVVVLHLRGFKRWPLGFWLLGFGIFSLLIAFGKYTPLHHLLYNFVPGFSSLRVPARFILLANFALAMLAGYALASLPLRAAHPERSGAQSKGRQGRGLRGGVLMLALGVLGFGVFVLLPPLAFGRQPAWAALFLALTTLALTALLLRFKPSLLPLLLFLELFAFGGFVEVDRADPNAGYKRGPAVDYLLAQPGPTRIDLATTKWQPDAPAVFGLESITGISNPLALAHYDRYYWSVGYRGSPQYNFLNAQFVVADKNSPPADATFVPIFNEDPDVDIYLNTNAMPRIHLIYDPIFAADPEAAFAAIHVPTFNPASQVVLESPITNYQLPMTNLQPNIFYTDYRPGHFTIVTQTPEPAFLVLAEVWYPGWRATVGGDPVQIIRANTAFMAVQIPPGESAVTFNFTSPMLAIGAIISLLAILLSVFLLTRQTSNDKRKTV